MIERNASFIKINRKFCEWEWYTDINTKVVFLHLLLRANYKQSRFKGYNVPIGSIVIGYEALAQQTSLTVRNVRTAIKHLKQTGEVNIQVTSKFSIITLINWELYQRDNSKGDKQVTSKRQASDKQVTPSKEGKEGKEVKHKDDFIFSLCPSNVDKEAWKDYMDIRKKLKAVNSERAVASLAKKLEGFGSKGEEALDNAIQNSWKTVYEPSGDKSFTKGRGGAGAEAWDKLLAKIGLVGSDEYPQFDDPKISKALYSFGTWMELCRMTSKQASFDYKPKFIEAYGKL